MTQDQEQLWTAIKNFEFDDPKAEFSFSDRLARENGWTLEFALDAIEEYKKFMFLICISKETLTPSDIVDQVWHLHLLYTKSYWITWCDEVLGRKIHHSPTKGGSTERKNFKRLYQNTLELYASAFGIKAPARFWPGDSDRFKRRDVKWVDRAKFWIIKKPFFQ